MNFLTKLRTAIAFYTVLPVVGREEVLELAGIALYAPLVGAGLGWALAGVGWVLGIVHGDATLWRSLLLVLLNIWLTGGLHLDGAMDTADGLAVTETERRLEVMADSRTGAFGAIALVSIVLGKWIGLAELLDREEIWWILPSVWAWSRWGQLRAIQAFPYLRSSGKGKFHQVGIDIFAVMIVGLLILSVLLLLGCELGKWRLALILATIPSGISWWLGSYFYHQLEGHTGDTYGAIVEWTEALSLLVLVPVL